MLLVGSKALQSYMPLDRVIHDWDIWMSGQEYNDFMQKYKQYLVKETTKSSIFDINGNIVEVKLEHNFEPTDQEIWHLSLWSKNEIETPYGKCRVPSIQHIYDMKAATAAYIPEWKHNYDKEQIKKHYEVENNTELFQRRLEETRIRVETSKMNKKSFFHRTKVMEEKLATIPEYIEHDRLHDLITSLVGEHSMPMFKRITTADTDIAEELFNNLNYAQKIDLMVEESLVLALERWFIPQMIENGINSKLIPMFYSNNEASPSYRLLHHTCIKGLKGEAEYITSFARENFNIIEKKWIWAKSRIYNNNGFPDWFYTELFDLREKYKQGKKIGLHHG